MHKMIEESVELNVPARVAYEQWTQFEKFPEFMAGVKEVRQLDDAHLHWRAQVAGKEEEWDAEITEQIPGKRIAWRNTSGAHNSGVVTFHRLSEESSRLMLQMECETDGLAETIGAAMGVLRRRVAADLNRFKHFIEERQEATGAWEGHIPSKDDLVGH
jgi:uncharacterized membrane protein